jgi:hypothetical protein
MTRSLYSGLIHLHPREFRESFGPEMLWIFDETSASPLAGASLVGDAAVSFARQWVIGQAAWKVPVALVGGMLYFMLAATLIVPRNIPRFDAPADFSLSSLAWPDQPGR